MGRFFLLILILNTIDKANIFMQEIFFRDLSPIYFELKYHVWPRMIETKFCMLFGFIKSFVDFLSQFYTLWLAVLIKQILKDPIHRLNRYMILYHILTILICMLLCLYVQLANGFGVEVSIVLILAPCNIAMALSSKEFIRLALTKILLIFC